MGFFKRIRCKTKSGRGDTEDADAVIEALTNNWDEVNNALNALDDGQKAELREKIDPIAEDNDPLPFDMLCGSL